MKESGLDWAGMIPSHWSVSPVKKEYNFFTGGTPDTKNELYYGDENTWVNISDLNGKYVSESAKHLSNEGVEAASIPQSPKGSLLFSFKLSVGAVAFCGADVYTNEAIATFTDDTRNDLNFLYYAAPLEIIQNANVNIYGAKLLNQNLIRNAPLIMPPVNEQKTIAAYLDTQCKLIDAQIEAVKQSIQKLDSLKQSFISEAVLKGVDGYTEMKSSGVQWISAIPNDWNVIPLKQHFTFTKGLPITKENLVDFGIPVISYGQIHSKSNSGTEISDDLIRYVSEDYNISNPDCLTAKGDLIIADTSEDLDGCGNCVYVDRDMQLFAGYHSMILHSPSSDDNKYFAYLMKSDAWRSQIRSSVYGVKLFSITKGILSDCTLIVPPVESRRRIVSFLDDVCKKIDSVKTIQSDILTELDSYKQAIIFEYVTGKKQVPQEA